MPTTIYHDKEHTIPARELLEGENVYPGTGPAAVLRVGRRENGKPVLYCDHWIANVEKREDGFWHVLSFGNLAAVQHVEVR